MKVRLPSMDLTTAWAEYQAIFLPSRNLAERTRREYRTDLAQLTGFLQRTCKLSTVDQVERKHLEAYLAELDHRGFAGSTRRRKVASTRSFFAFLEDQGATASSPARKLIPPATEQPEPRVLTEAEYKRLLDAVRHETRDAAIIEVLLQTGMRLSEVARLTVDNLELPVRVSREDTGAVHILRGKGRKTRTVSLNFKACRAIKAYLAIRPNVQIAGLFLTKFKAPMSPRSIENVVAKYLQEAGINDASVHTLRHTFGTEHVRRGTSLKVVQDALGHASLKTTQIYVHLVREQMDKQLQENAL